MASQNRFWSGLAPRTRASYKRRGISPATYNAWWRKTPAQRTAIRAKAAAAGTSPLDYQAHKAARTSLMRAARRYARLPLALRQATWERRDAEFWQLYSGYRVQAQLEAS
jgi:hypothetical protein